MTMKISKAFQNALLRYSQTEDDAKRQEIEKQLWRDYGSEQTVFVLDMSGFSMLTRKYGIVHYLSMVRRMQLTTKPIIKSYGGRMIKYEADNCFAVFPDPLAAVNAAITMQYAFAASNLLTTEDLDVQISCGIDYGNILIVNDEDCFGDAVNRACKMGEDLGGAGEILVTKEAMDRIPTDSGIKCLPMELSVSGITIFAFSIEYQAAG